MVKIACVQESLFMKFYVQARIFPSIFEYFLFFDFKKLF